MMLDELLKEKRTEILEIAANYGAYNIRVFGSVVRGETRPESDIDFLVELEAGRDLLDHAGLWIDLRDLLGVEIDVVTENGLKARIKERVLHEAIAL